MLETDLEHSKIGSTGKFIREADVRKRTFEVLLSNMDILLDHFYWMIGAGRDSYPTITWLHFSEILVKMQIADDPEKTLAFSDVDLLIYTVCTPIKDLIPAKPDRQLCRYEFWEMLVRLAKVKFMDKAVHAARRAPSIDKAVEMLVELHFKQGHLPLQTSRAFRESEIWKLEIDDLLVSNLSAIQDLYKYFLSPDEIDPITSRPYAHLNQN